MNSSHFKKGHLPHNKGLSVVRFLKKKELFEKGEEIECKKHGPHKRWRIHSVNNVQCYYCSADNQKARRLKNPIKFLLIDAKSHAKKKDIIFDLEEIDIVELLAIQNNSCALSGVCFDKILKFSLDRINPNIGYIRSNVQLLIFDVNRMKTNLSQDRFLELCKFIVQSESGKSKPKKGKKK